SLQHELRGEEDLHRLKNNDSLCAAAEFHPPDRLSVDIMLRLKAQDRVAGVAVVIPSTPETRTFSPHQKCPNAGY
ncbi:hypothetical protein scyTo_0022570, partial [Scyliorhinus torazame]|nr:hypothetical protein [Scyliorhinus torazame]